jgi:hypothetical protein
LSPCVVTQSVQANKKRPRRALQKALAVASVHATKSRAELSVFLKHTVSSSGDDGDRFLEKMGRLDGKSFNMILANLGFDGLVAPPYSLDAVDAALLVSSWDTPCV